MMPFRDSWASAIDAAILIKPTHPHYGHKDAHFTILSNCANQHARHLSYFKSVLIEKPEGGVETKCHSKKLRCISIKDAMTPRK